MDNESKKGQTGGKEKGRRSKKGALIFIAVMFALLLILPVLNLLSQRLPSMPDKNDGGEATVTARTYPKEWFAAPDYNQNVLSDPEYEAADRALHYKIGNETVMIDGDASDYGTLCAFWDDYFRAAIAGSESMLSGMHTDDYVEKFGGFDAIAPQKIYNITVELLDRRAIEDEKYAGGYVSYFNVSYCIKDNNGTFRNDFFEDDVSVPLIYEVVENNGRTLINNYSRQSMTTPNDDDRSPSWIMPVVWSIVLLVSVTILLIVKSGFCGCLALSALAALILSFIFPHNIVAQIVTFSAVAALSVALWAVMKKRKKRNTSAEKVAQDSPADLTDGRA